MKIGVFDSGFGGLEVLKEIIKELPQYDFIYLGDTQRAPYGNRSQELVYQFVEQAVNFLKGCGLIILACNTASSEALRRIQHNFPHKKVLGVIIPCAEEAVLKTKNKKIGVIGTQGTIKSKAFVRELKKLDKSIKVFQKALPLLVPIIEEGTKEPEIIKIYLEKNLKPLVEKDIDTLILGCTHYGLLEKEIQGIVKNITVLSEGKIVAKKLKEYLKRHPEIERKLSKKGKREFLTTDLTEKFSLLGSKFFGQKINPKKCPKL